MAESETGNWWDNYLKIGGVTTGLGLATSKTWYDLISNWSGAEDEQLAVPVGTDQTSDKSVTQALYYQNQGPDAAFAQFINWMFQNGINHGSFTPNMQNQLGGVVPAGEQVQQLLNPSGLGQADQARAQLLLLTDNNQRKEAIDFLSNVEVDEVTQRVNDLIDQRIHEMVLWVNSGTPLALIDQSDWAQSVPAYGYGKLQEISDGSKRHRNLVKKMIEERNIDVLSPEEQEIFLNDETLNKVLFGLHEEAANGFLVELSQNNPLMMLGNLTDPVSGGVSKYGFVQSYNGTEYGQIETVYDLFSGGMIGPFNTSVLLSNLYEATRDVNGYSEVLNRLQSELYAWGYIDSVEQWGHLENIQAGSVATVDALQRFQTEIYQEALKEQQSIGGDSLISQNQTPRVKKVMDQMLRKRLAGGPTLMASDIESQLINNVADKIEGGMSGMMGASDDTKHLVTQMIRDMDPRRQEALSGGGGSIDEVRLMDHMLSGFYGTSYGTSDWAVKVDWNSDSPNGQKENYQKYGVRTGAIGNLDSNYLNESEDITRAVLRQIIARDVEDFQTITEEQIADALTVYGETAGLKNNVTEGGKFTRDDYTEMARSVYGNWSGVRYETDPDEKILEMRARQALHGSSDTQALSSAISRLTPRGSNRVRV